MDFWIQTGSPETVDISDVVDDIDGAMRQMYPDDTERMILSWNGLPVSLVYSEDVQVLVDDIVIMLETLAEGTEERVHVYWGPSAFQVEWWITRQGEDLTIDSRWYSLDWGPADLLNQRSRLVVPEAVFRREWLKVLRRVVDDITARAVEMEGTLVFDRARALLAAGNLPPASAEQAARGARALPSEGETVAFRAGGESGAVLWRPDADIARLFIGHEVLVAELLGVPSVIGCAAGDADATIDIPALLAFCTRALARYGRTGQGVERSLTVGFLATALELLRRAGHDVPPTDPAEQRAAWSALRDQHAAQMPR
ncbi:DUF6086 family protein [Streptantibioticus silvisoli]|uniref:DUF6086 family protein n=1 Tax=Streptantibioticus silvisoli TaxID=2705255 RepID=A0ABT6VU89_9ACTN|nr:DUF6086 family protein [Streptantibioticus silvisoli]MDI5962038.1 DUF6086 family protein [Streptantibioticus silvisoli]